MQSDDGSLHEENNDEIYQNEYNNSSRNDVTPVSQNGTSQQQFTAVDFLLEFNKDMQIAEVR